MRWTSGVAWAVALLGSGSHAADATVYHDSETGFTFSQYSASYSLNEAITFRIALPSPVTSGSAYDVVLQVVAPVDVGWGGLAWGGSMTYNPLTVGWANGYSGPVVSSRYATAHAMPTAWAGASYQMFKTGTHTNGTHWQYTAKCSGCSQFTESSGRTMTLNPSGSNRLAFAYAAAKPSNPSSNTSTIPVHDVYGYWNHDFSVAGNPTFTSLVAKNLG